MGQVGGNEQDPVKKKKKKKRKYTAAGDIPRELVTEGDSKPRVETSRPE